MAFSWVVLNLNNSAAHADGDRLRPISCTEFRHNAFDVRFHSFFRDGLRAWKLNRARCVEHEIPQ
jgi:hypothetical protein